MKQIILIFLAFIVYQLNSQSVGIGTTSPEGELHVTLPLSFSGISFTGTGPNNIVVDNSSYSGEGLHLFQVEVTNAGPNPNIIRWSNNGGITWTENVQASTSPIAMGYDVSFYFNSAYGHVYGDTWTWSLLQAAPNGLVVKNGKTALGHTNPTQRLDVSGGIKTDSIQIMHNSGENKVLISDNAGNGRWKVNSTLKDTDGDTKIDLELNPDEDKIRFSTGGKERWLMAGNRLEPANIANSIFIGKDAGLFDNGIKNIGIGISTLYNNGAGNFNVAIGSYALSNIQNGSYNIAIGDSSLFNNKSSNNIGIGSSCLKNNEYGDNNIAMGFRSLYKNIGGSNCIALGAYALENAINVSGQIAIGAFSLQNNTSGSNNYAIGSSALQDNTIGSGNIAFGQNALANNTVGNDNLAIGNGAQVGNISGSNNIAIGSYVLGGSNNVNNIAIGKYALQNNNTGDNNTAIGGACQRFNQTGHDNTGLGLAAMISITTANNCVGLGSSSMYNTTTGNANVSIGVQALYNNVTGEGNVSIGTSSSYSVLGSFNTSLGHNAYNSGNFTNSTAIGASAAITASNQVRIGNSSVSSIGGYVSWSNLSDKRFKTNINENVPGLLFILKLKPITYQIDVDALNKYLNISDSLYKGNEFMHMSKENKKSMVQSGFIAQDVEKVAKEINFEFSGIDKPKNENDLYGLRYAEFTVPLVKAVQELNEMNNKLETENIIFNKELHQLKRELAEFKKVLEQD